MGRSTVFRYYPGTLAANASINFECFGDFVFLLSNTGANATLELSFANTANQKTPVGLILKSTEVFNRITIKNTDTVSTDFVLIIGQGDIDYKALVIGNTVTTSPAQSTSGTFASDNSVSTIEQIFTAATAKAVILYADSANTDNICIGFDNTTTATKKIFCLAPGQIYVFESYRGDIWAIAQSGTQTISVSSY